MPARAATYAQAAAALMAALAMLAGRFDPARAQPLVFDLSDHLIAISTAFTGTEVVAFGALDEASDVVIVVMGPPRRVVVRRAEPIAGVWVNRESLTFVDVPTFYGVATNRPIEEIASVTALERHGIGLDHLQLQPEDGTEADADTVEAFRQALIADMQTRGVFGVDIGQVAFLGDRLFRTTISFPANVPTGQFQVSAYVFRDGNMLTAQTSPLVVSKIGLGAEIYWFAQVHAATYGIIAIVIAVVAGWLAGVVFRR